MQRRERTSGCSFAMEINQTYKGVRFKRVENLDLVAFRVTAIRQGYFRDLVSVIKKRGMAKRRTILGVEMEKRN